jgi:hypothetical protein
MRHEAATVVLSRGQWCSAVLRCCGAAVPCWWRLQDRNGASPEGAGALRALSSAVLAV